MHYFALFKAAMDIWVGPPTFRKLLSAYHIESPSAQSGTQTSVVDSQAGLELQWSIAKREPLSHGDPNIFIGDNNVLNFYSCVVFQVCISP